MKALGVRVIKRILISLILITFLLSGCVTEVKEAEEEKEAKQVEFGKMAKEAEEPEVQGTVSVEKKEKEKFVSVEKKEEKKFILARKGMVEEQLKARDVSNEKVLNAMLNVPRHEFVLPEYLNEAHNDHPLPIGFGQTISQPYIVGLMTQELAIKGDEKVLEIGTGSGYQAAVLSQLAGEVYSIEIIPELAEKASKKLNELGFVVEVKQGDGYFGWQEKAPFDAIMVTAAATHIPRPLIAQLKDSGRLIIPLGSTLYYQNLTLITKHGEELQAKYITSVRFVPMTGEIEGQ